MPDQPAPPARTLPAVDYDTAAFWQGGATGALQIFRCADCAYLIHPPVRFCPKCEGRDVSPQPVSGRGTVTTFTVNHKAWVPGLPVPYVLALVSLDEQDDVRIACNIVGCPAEDVTFGMPVEVCFETIEDLAIPLFRPVSSGTQAGTQAGVQA